jgi:PIN domain nuclease of toxin-antitoxin system
VNLLLDTHALLWFIVGSTNLSTKARALIEDEDNPLFISVASLWEMAIKISLGKLTLTQPFESLIAEQLSINSIELMDIKIDHVGQVARLPLHHRDPFDRLLVAQAIVEQMPIVSADAAFDLYSVRRLW